ncbi:MAG: hypothetical protein GYB53_20960 [Rhodobacteraceae bacterium]|nr:hypothetical protein [Paracoccaceae bacterium]MBR9823036.1 hypothetical protein [Paracoccaceae bacterium]
MKILTHTPTDETCDLDNATALFRSADIKVHGDKAKPWAWQFDGGEIHDADDVEESTVWRVRGVDHESPEDAEEALNREFWAMCEEIGADHVAKLKADRPMRSEEFNAWTDGLCKDGEICDDAYSDCGVDD